jgi:hypothetical protein
MTTKIDRLLKEAEALVGSNILEMANLLPKDTGIDGVFIYVSQAQGSHGPRIKVRNRNDRPDYEFIVSISNNPEVLQGFVFVDNRTLQTIKKWVILNKDTLDKLWNGNFASNKEFKNQLQKINEEYKIKQDEYLDDEWDEAAIGFEDIGIEGIYVCAYEQHKNLDPYVRISWDSPWFKHGFSMSISHTPEVLGGDVYVDDDTLNRIKEWVILNYQALMNNWDGTVADTFDFLDMLKPV